MHESLSRWKCATATQKQCIWVSQYSQSCERQRDATQRREHSQASMNITSVFFWLRCSSSAYLNKLQIRRKPGQCSDFDHPSQSPLSPARGIWCWLDKGKWDRHACNKREQPTGLEDSLLVETCFEEVSLNFMLWLKREELDESLANAISA